MSDPAMQLRERLATVSDLGAAAALLSWDQQTYMPPGGAGARAEQLATLSRMSHEVFTADATGALIEAASDAVSGLPTDSDDAALLRVARRDFERLRKLPSAFVADFTRTRAQARQDWIEARKQADFGRFLPVLTKIIALTRQQAEYLGYSEHPYDALLDAYEPELRTAEVRTLFAELRDGLRPLIAAAQANAGAVNDEPLHRGYDEQVQLQVSEQIIAELGYDFNRGRQDLAPHPFCINFAPTDVRITTRVTRNELNMCLFGSLHEMGHALYEQGVPVQFARTPLARGASLGIHESQSRMWENLVGRSRPFWRRFLPTLQARFPQLNDVDSEGFYRAVNRAQPSLIRVEADELTYNAHIMVRFELELALLEGALDPVDLPAAWNAKMQAYLGLTPPDDAVGVLQDIHWSGGMIGYFPTYTLGNVISAQLYGAAQQQQAGLSDELAGGEYGGLLHWLRANLHAHGRKFTPRELLQRITGGDLDAKPYLAYLGAKFGELYG
ncbi:MAG: carboxypeptidase M32 [Oscillochloris sp.]|nr:carboxypeptidase M32 [Oscillochloris sp.]